MHVTPVFSARSIGISPPAFGQKPMALAKQRTRALPSSLTFQAYNQLHPVRFSSTTDTSKPLTPEDITWPTDDLLTHDQIVKGELLPQECLALYTNTLATQRTFNQFEVQEDPPEVQFNLSSEVFAYTMLHTANIIMNPQYASQLFKDDATLEMNLQQNPAFAESATLLNQLLPEGLTITDVNPELVYRILYGEHFEPWESVKLPEAQAKEHVKQAYASLQHRIQVANAASVKRQIDAAAGAHDEELVEELAETSPDDAVAQMDLADAMDSAPDNHATGDERKKIEMKVTLDEGLGQLMTAFIRHYDKTKLDRTSENFIRFVLVAAKHPDAPADLKKHLKVLLDAKASLAKAAEEQAATFLKDIEKGSPKAFTIRLEELRRQGAFRPDPVDEAADPPQYTQIKELIADYEAVYDSPLQREQRGEQQRRLDKVLNHIPWFPKDMPDHLASLGTNGERLQAVRQGLNDSHYGLDDLKDEAIKLTALEMHVDAVVKHLGGKPDALKAFLDANESIVKGYEGPPGTGKTSLAESEARVLGKDIIEVPCEKITGPEDIYGYPLTYKNPQPGLIAQGFLDARVTSSNPIIFLDEIDKMDEGAVQSLLQLLDKKRNREFKDDYLGVTLDLSRCTFIASANDLDKVPGPVKNRIRFLHTEGYNEDEKVEMAQQYLIPRIRHQNGLSQEIMATLYPDAAITSEPFALSDDVIRTICQKWAKDPGARTLNDWMVSIAAAVLVEVMIHNTVPEITPENVVDYMPPGDLNQKGIGFGAMIDYYKAKAARDAKRNKTT